MPRVDDGAFVIDVSSVLSLDVERVRAVIRWALSTKPLVLVEPTIAFVSSPSSSRSTPLGLGVGSLISMEKPTVDVKYYVVRRVFWANGLKVGMREPSFKVLSGSRVTVEGVIVALDVKDPVAMLVNGVRGVHGVNVNITATGTPLASVNGITVLYREDHSYKTTLVEGEGAKRVEYMATLISSTYYPQSRTLEVEI